MRIQGQKSAVQRMRERKSSLLNFATPSVASVRQCQVYTRVGGGKESYRYRFSVEWHMQLMQWLPGKWVATESSSAPFSRSAA